MYPRIKATQLSGKSPNAGLEGTIEEPFRSACKDEKPIPIMKEKKMRLDRSKRPNKMVSYKEKERENEEKWWQLGWCTRTRTSCMWRLFVCFPGKRTRQRGLIWTESKRCNGDCCMDDYNLRRRRRIFFLFLN